MVTVFFFNSFIYLFGWAGSLLLRGLFFVVASGDYSLAVVHGLLIAVASLAAENGLSGVWASVAVALGSRAQAQ